MRGGFFTQEDIDLAKAEAEELGKVWCERPNGVQCLGGMHAFTWTASSVEIATPAGIPCQCGMMVADGRGGVIARTLQ